MFAYAEAAAAAASRPSLPGGRAAHLPGMIGCQNLRARAGRAGGQPPPAGVDSLHSIVQMPKGHSGGHLCHGRPPVQPMPRCLPWRCWPTRPGAAPAAGLPRRADRRARQCGAAGMTRRGAHPWGARRDPQPPGARWAYWAAASWAACSSTRRRPWATSRPCSTPIRPARRFDQPPPSSAAATATRMAWPSWPACRDAITTEFENVPAVPGTSWAQRLPVARRSGWRWRKTARRKGAFRGVRRALCAVCGDRNAEQLAAVPATCCPAFENARLGYDGKGQAASRPAEELAAAWDELGKCPACWKNAAAAAGMLGHRRAWPRWRDGAPAGAAQPAPRRHPGGDRGL